MVVLGYHRNRTLLVEAAGKVARSLLADMLRACWIDKPPSPSGVGAAETQQKPSAQKTSESRDRVAPHAGADAPLGLELAVP